MKGYRTKQAALRASARLIYDERQAVRLDDGSWGAVGWASHFEPHDRFLYGPHSTGALNERLWPDGTVARARP